MRRGNDPHVDPHRPLATDADQLAILDDAQQPYLRWRGELPDLVEEEGPAVGLLEPAFPACRGAGERTLLVPEQLRVDQLRRDRPAVDPAERPAAKRRVLVDRARDDLLAGAGLAEEQHRCGAPRHQLRPGHDRRQPGVAANQTLVADGPIAGDQMFRYGSQRGSRRAMFL